MEKTLPLIIFAACQTVSLLIMVVGSTTPTVKLSNYGTDAVQLWSASAFLASISIIIWIKYYLSKKNLSVHKKILISILPNTINILILIAPALLVIFALIMAIFFGATV